VTENTQKPSGFSGAHPQPSGPKPAEKDVSLKGSENLRNDFLIAFSDKLRNHLWVVKESIAQLGEGLLGGINAEQRNVLKNAGQNVAVLCDMVLDLQNIFSVDVGQEPLQKQQVDIVNFVKTVHASLDRKIKEKDLVWQSSFSAPSIQAFLDPEKIRQVLACLLEYMIYYAASGPLEFRVEEKVDAIECRILNSGSRGFAGDLGRLFDKFHAPLEKGEMPDDKIRLSLAFCKGIVELYKGRIWAENTAEGGGFGFTLPKISPRDFLSGMVRESVGAAARDNTDLSIISLKVHLFEHLNSRETQQYFDVIIQALQKTLRAGRDKVVGSGHTFLILLPHTRRPGILPVIERLEKSLMKDAGLGSPYINFKAASFLEDGMSAKELLEKIEI